MTWNGRKVHIGGIGGVSTRADCRRRGYASIALNAAIQTMRDHEAVQFALLFCEPHNFAFYQSRGWHPFTGEIYAEQPDGKIRFEAMAPFVFDLKRARRGKAPSTYAACRGDPCTGRGGIRPARSIICHP